MKKILLIGPYPPLYSYGGPTRSIKGLFDTLSNGINHCTVVSPKRELNRKQAINGLPNNSNVIFSDYPLYHIISKGYKYDIIWFNSFFELKLIVLLLIKMVYRYKLIISTRGQLSDKAINTSNPLLKKTFIKVVSLISSNVSFHATDDKERLDILKSFKTNSIKTLKNLFSLKLYKNDITKPKFIFYSRIHKKKGLDILLDHLIENNIDLELDIYGFIEDNIYWEKCLAKIDKINSVKYCGCLDDGDISKLKNKYSYFILPTLNENFGHVIIELISLGCIPIISRGTTPFDELINSNIGLNFDLKSSKNFKEIIENIYSYNDQQIVLLKNNVYKIYKSLDINQEVIKKDYLNFVKSL